MKYVKRASSYRVQKMVDGKRYSLTFDHKPKQSEILEELNKKIDSAVTSKNAPNSHFRDCAMKYLEIKENVLSASTKRSYNTIINNLNSEFSELPLKDITQIELQQLVNDLSVNHTPKTVRNYYTFIISVIGMFIQNPNYNVTLPKPQKKEEYIPTRNDVNAILSASNDKYYIIFALARYGLRRSEIMGLDIADVFPDHVSINKSMVLDANNNWIIQPYNKTVTSTRDVPIDTDLYNRIQKQGYVFKGHPDKIFEYLKRKQKELGIPAFKLHAFRHYCATELYQAGFNSKDIMKVLGWSSDSVMKRIYTHARIDKDKSMQQRMLESLK